VIDDDLDSRRLISEHLEAMAFTALTASSAEAGIRLAREERPDLITLDLIMPGVDGWEALRELKAASDLQDIPVVIASVVAGEQDRGSLLGAVDLLTKPIDPKELLRVLRRNLREPRERQVLVVEDDPGTQEVFRKNLADAGLEVRLAGNGREAEEAMERFTPDLILLDLMMPVMDGTVFLQRLRENPDHVDTPVVICTAKDLSEEEREELQSEATELLEKGEGFESKLQVVLAHQFPQGPTVDQAPPSDGDPGVEGHGDQE
jgi:CheY-like chemotaxis protein